MLLTAERRGEDIVLHPSTRTAAEHVADRYILRGERIRSGSCVMDAATLKPPDADRILALNRFLEQQIERDRAEKRRRRHGPGGPGRAPPRRSPLGGPRRRAPHPDALPAGGAGPVKVSLLIRPPAPPTPDEKEPESDPAAYTLYLDRAAICTDNPATDEIGRADTWEQLHWMARGAAPFERGGRLWALNNRTRTILYMADIRLDEDPARHRGTAMTPGQAALRVRIDRRRWLRGTRDATCATPTRATSASSEPSREPRGSRPSASTTNAGSRPWTGRRSNGAARAGTCCTASTTTRCSATPRANPMLHARLQTLRTALERLAPLRDAKPPGSRTDPNAPATRPGALPPITRLRMGTFHSSGGGCETAGCIAGLAITLFPDAAPQDRLGPDHRAPLAARTAARPGHPHRRSHPGGAAPQRLQPPAPCARTLHHRSHHARTGGRGRRPLHGQGGPLAHRHPENTMTTSASGVLPVQELRNLAAESRIIVPNPMREQQHQPASLDLRLRATAHRIQPSFLTGPAATVRDKLGELGHVTARSEPAHDSRAQLHLPDRPAEAPVSSRDAARQGEPEERHRTPRRLHPGHDRPRRRLQPGHPRLRRTTLA